MGDPIRNRACGRRYRRGALDAGLRPRRQGASGRPCCKTWRAGLDLATVKDALQSIDWAD
ncbi:MULTISPECIES: hypothetical protein [Paracoccus]|uniref:hypothetical protein n=1 Tax=Paracoccus TaxID=265 RepID=UPI000AE96A42|nr:MULTISPECIES: hypothetical protein [Paracoccus]MCV2448285.1 hypothetical protein [Paracoccus sp. DMF]MDQ7777748.1 hypothetical protein [Paracoccus aminovorans]